MSLKVPFDLYNAPNALDPGNGGSIQINRNPHVVALVSAGAETRTIARPTRVGATLYVFGKTVAGAITVTVTGGYNEAGDSVFSMTEAGQFLELRSNFDGTNFYWRLVSHHGLGNTSPTEASVLDGVTATAAEINMAADNSENVEVVTTTNPITAAESGKTFFLSSATGFVSTLPAPAAGLRYKFIVGATAPSSGNHTVVTTSSANVIFGVLAVATEDDVGAIASQEDTISFVASVALPGDWAEVISDGTNWYVTGCATVAEAITTTQASA